jgi:hypothetical protein
MNKEDKSLTFTITTEELKKAKNWISKQKKKYGSEVGTIGDRFSYEFIPTSIGTAIFCNDGLTKESECISEI